MRSYIVAMLALLSLVVMGASGWVNMYLDDSNYIEQVVFFPG